MGVETLDSLYVAWRYIVFNKGKTVTLVASIALVATLPLALSLLLDRSERELMARATDTPLVLGAKGSALDLVMNTLYFDEQTPQSITMRGAYEVDESGLAFAIPMYVRFQARGFAVVGTTLDYFDFRGLNFAQGRPFVVLGDCVVGADVAASLRLAPGATLVSSPEALFDLAGVYPLKMNVVGVLERTHGTDDQAVFVDLKTTWIIQGLGHGHEDLRRVQDTTVILERDEQRVTAGAKLTRFTEITPQNIDGFHFHGDLSDYPITAAIVDAADRKSATILQGRYLETEDPYQITAPRVVIDGLLQTVFRVKKVIDGVVLVVGVAVVLTVILVFALSLRLREREIQTMFKLGCSRVTLLKLVGAEIGIIVVLSAVLCGVALALTRQFAGDLVRGFFV